MAIKGVGEVAEVDGMNESVTDSHLQGLVLAGPGRWGLYDAAAYERVERRLRQRDLEPQRD